MLKGVLDYFKYYPIKGLKADKDLDYFVKVLAVSTYADGMIKNIEILETTSIIEDFLSNHFDRKNKLLNLEEMDLLKEYLHKKYVERLKEYKKDSSAFLDDKLYILDYDKDKQYYREYVKKIIEADNIVTEEEKALLEGFGR